MPPKLHGRERARGLGDQTQGEMDGSTPSGGINALDLACDVLHAARQAKAAGRTALDVVLSPDRYVVWKLACEPDVAAAVPMVALHVEPGERLET